MTERRGREEWVLTINTNNNMKKFILLAAFFILSAVVLSGLSQARTEGLTCRSSEIERAEWQVDNSVNVHYLCTAASDYRWKTNTNHVGQVFELKSDIDVLSRSATDAWAPCASPMDLVTLVASQGTIFSADAGAGYHDYLCHTWYQSLNTHYSWFECCGTSGGVSGCYSGGDYLGSSSGGTRADRLVASGSKISISGITGYPHTGEYVCYNGAFKACDSAHIGAIGWNGTNDELCTASGFIKASDYLGQIKYSENVNVINRFDSVSNGVSWYYCDAYANGGNWYNGLMLGEWKQATIPNHLHATPEITVPNDHDYLCYKVTIGAYNYETLGECCDTSSCFSSGNGERFSNGQTKGNYKCVTMQGPPSDGGPVRLAFTYLNAKWVYCPSENADYNVAEKCDNIDNNCNGFTDEDITPISCSNTNSFGTCTGTKTCSAGAWGACDAKIPAAEICAGGADEDCDGLIDLADPDCGRVNAPYWTNMIESAITNAQVSDTVKIIVRGDYINGKNAIFKIYEFTQIIPTGIPILDYLSDIVRKDTYITTKTSVIANNKAVTTWQIPNQKIYYVKAEIGGTALQNASDYLDAKAIGDNSLPVVKITSPLQGSVFKTNAAINFLQDSYDIDDGITYLWSFGNGDTSTAPNSSYTYAETTPGQNGGPKTVTLTVTDSRGLKANDTVRILIDSAANDAPLAIISSPKNNAELNKNFVICNATLSKDDLTSFADLTFAWQFDDGQIRSAKGMEGALYNKIYVLSGPHSVTLTVSD